MNVRAINPRAEVVGTEAASREIQIDSRFIMNIGGKDFVLYAGLLDLAHQKRLKKIIVDILQYPNQENGFTAICKAVAETTEGEVFTDIGDANSTNVNKKIAHHIIRMASTRAKARCLRDLTNVGLCSVEELGDSDDIAGSDNAQVKKPVAIVKPLDKGSDKDGSHPKASIAQLKAIESIAKRLKVKDETLTKMVVDQYRVAVADLSSSQAADFIRFLQKAS